MKVRTSVKKMWEECVIIRKDRKLFVKCKAHPRHNQKQKFYTYFARRQFIMINRPYFMISNLELQSKDAEINQSSSSQLDEFIINNKNIV